MYHVLFNPLAGSGQGEAKSQELKNILKDEELKFYNLTEIKDMKAFLDSIRFDDKVVIGGGDGTLYFFANDVKDIEVKQQVLYYPAGTGNDFAHDIADKALENGLFVVNDYIKDLPKVTVNGKTSMFLNGIGYGIDGYCCEIGDILRKKSDKPVNYAGIAIKGLLFHFKPRNAHVTVDGKEYDFKKIWLAPTMNGRFYGGGMNMAPGQDRLNSDGKLSVVIMHGSGKLKTLIVFPSIFKGEHVKHTEMVTVLEGKDITVEFDNPCALQIDGETVLNVKKYEAVSGK